MIMNLLKKIIRNSQYPVDDSISYAEAIEKWNIDRIPTYISIAKTWLAEIRDSIITELSASRQAKLYPKDSTRLISGIIESVYKLYEDELTSCKFSKNQSLPTISLTIWS